MLNGIETITTTALELALDAASLRQQALSANIANANTIGYARLQVDFETQLDEARRSLENQHSIERKDLANVKPCLQSIAEFGDASIKNPLENSTKIQLDLELTQLAHNAVHYQALLKGLNKHFALLSSAVSEGRK